MIFLAACTPLATKRKIYAIHIHGDWCSTCALVDKVVHQAFTELKNKNIEFIVFDETDPISVMESEKIAKAKQLEEIFEFERHTGELLYVDQVSKNILTRFYGVNSKAQYQKAAQDLVDGKEVANIEAKLRNYQLSKPELEEIKKAKLLAIDLHHDRCGGCSITTPVFEKVAKSYKKNKDVAFMTFDLTNDETIKYTQNLASELGLEKIYREQKHTGEVLFVDAKKKEIMASLVLEQDETKYHSLIERLI